MHASVLGILSSALLKRLPIRTTPVPVDIMQLQDLGLMSHIILSGALFKVVDQMLQFSDRAAVIKAVFFVGHNQQECASVLEDSFPFSQSTQWVSSMLQAVAGKGKVVRAGLDHAQIGGFGNMLPAW